MSNVSGGGGRDGVGSMTVKCRSSLWTTRWRWLDVEYRRRQSPTQRHGDVTMTSSKNNTHTVYNAMIISHVQNSVLAAATCCSYNPSQARKTRKSFPRRKTEVALIIVSLPLRQTPLYTARPRYEATAW